MVFLQIDMGYLVTLTCSALPLYSGACGRRGLQRRLPASGRPRRVDHRRHLGELGHVGLSTSITQ